ncbi:MAG: aspartyl beta-hydroxylase [Pseudomonas sp.]|nr:MAG: aspartyl beta-hydroxylase [Pseudomonas sp.]
MRNFQRLATGVNVTPLMLAIQRRPELWKADTFLRDYPQGPFGEIDSIILRFPDRPENFTEEQVELYKQNKLPGYDQHESKDQPAYAILTEARPLVMSTFAAVGGERLGRVMINRIAPGGRIYPHADTPEHVKYYSRFHIVLQSMPGVSFRSEHEEAYWETGSVFWFNNALEHEIINRSDTDRIHLVLDARVSK